MTDVLDGVRDHYRATGLTERLKTALKTFGPEEQRLTPPQLESLALIVIGASWLVVLMRHGAFDDVATAIRGDHAFAAAGLGSRQ